MAGEVLVKWMVGSDVLVVRTGRTELLLDMMGGELEGLT